MRRLLRPSAALLALALLAPACKQDLTITGKVTEASSTQYVLEVHTTKPGIEVDVSGIVATTDDQGVALLTVPVERLSYMGGTTDLHVTVFGGNFISSYFGDGVITLPFSPNDAAKLGDATHWVKIGSGPRAASGGTLWDFGDAGGALMNDDGSLTIGLQAPAKATVTLLERTVVMDEDGRGAIEFTAAEILDRLPSDALMGGAPETPVTAKVTLADGSAKDLPLTAQWMFVGGESLRARLTALPTQPLPGQRNAERLVVHLDAQNRLYATGRKGPLSTIDIASIGTPKAPRKLSDCDGYRVVKDGVEGESTFSLPREAIDEEVVAWDAHTGKELGRKVFAAEDYCPFSATSDQRVLEVRPSGDAVVAWLSGL